MVSLKQKTTERKEIPSEILPFFPIDRVPGCRTKKLGVFCSTSPWLTTMRKECWLAIAEQDSYPYPHKMKSSPNFKHVCQITRWCRRLMLFKVLQHNRNSHWPTMDGVFPKAEMRSRDSLILTKSYAVLRNMRKHCFPVPQVANGNWHIPSASVCITHR